MDVLSEAVGPLTVAQWVVAVVAFLLLSSAIRAVKRRTASRQRDGDGSAGRCLGCGWQGQVSRYHRTCPRCGNSITRLKRGEQ